MPNKSNLIFFGLLVVVFSVISSKTRAQLCTGSLGDPVLHIDFGSGTASHGSALPNGTTTYSYVDDDFPLDGSYTIENATTGNIWWNSRDHTGNSGGYMMVVNAATSKTDYFYRTTVTGLCPGTTFEFAAWVANLLRSNDTNPPDITFTITTTADSVLATYNTGAIASTPNGLVWKQYGTYFTTPAGVSDVVITMTNNSNGGPSANDLALDDITFRPCGPMLTSSFINNGGTSVTQLACAGTNYTYNLSCTVSAGGYNNPVYQWQINTGSGWANITGANNTTYAINFQPAVVGTYKYRLVSSEAANAGSSNCQVASNELTINVNQQPSADFTAAVDYSTNCISKKVDFTDKSTPTTQISDRLWDFGDGQTSHLVNPSHTYTDNGKHTVTLSITGAGGCQSVITKQINVIPKIIADFDVEAQSCPGQPVIFTDKSTIADGAIVQWIWNFGDGTASVTYPDSRSPSYTYTKSGVYKPTLEVISSTQCVSDVTTKSITILPMDTPRFKLPDVCQADLVQFTDTTHFTNGAAGYTYSWNFGDAQATAANPNISASQNPRHRYSQTGVYTVSLTLTAPSGCTLTTSTPFTINGTNPTADFSISQPACASDSVILTNKSTVDFGNITRLQIYWDYDNAPNISSTYKRSATHMLANEQFKHLYSVPAGQLSKTYHIRMVASSGEICGSVSDQTIVVNASPTIALTPLNSICIESGVKQIIENKNGFTGTGIFSGPGVSPSGLFDPLAAGLGTHTVNYVFTSQNGCTYADSLSISVYKSPAISLQSSAVSLEGKGVSLNPVVLGEDLTYRWSPALGVSDPDILNPIFNPAENTTYTLTATTGGGCTGAAQVAISVLKMPVIPNAFTPNGDGVNDTWDIKYLNNYAGATVDVFNRNGAKVYTSTGYATSWDGKLKGKDLPFGVYYYVINPKNGREIITGSVTIIK